MLALIGTEFWKDAFMVVLTMLLAGLPIIWWVVRTMMPRKEITEELKAIRSQQQATDRAISNLAADVAYIRGKVEGNNG